MSVGGRIREEPFRVASDDDAFSISFSLSRPGSAGSTGRLCRLPLFTGVRCYQESRLCPYLQEVNLHSVRRVGTFLPPDLKATSEEQHLPLISAQQERAFDDHFARFLQMWKSQVNWALWLGASGSHENGAGVVISCRGWRLQGISFPPFFFSNLFQERNADLLYTHICYLKLGPCRTCSSRGARGSSKSVLGPKFSVLSSKSIKRLRELWSSHLLDVAVVALHTQRPLMLSLSRAPL